LVDDMKGITPTMRKSMDRDELVKFIRKMRGRDFTNQEVKLVREYMDKWGIGLAKEKGAPAMAYAKKLGAKNKEEFKFVEEYLDNIQTTSPEKFREMYGNVKNVNMDINTAIENKLETLQAPIHPQNEAMGKREIFFGRDLYIDKEDFLEKSPNNKYKRLTLDKEVRLRNSYVIKANRIEYNENGDVSTVYCTYDPETLGKNPPDGRKVKGVIHFVEVSKAIEAEFRIYDRLFLNPNPGSFDDLSSAINPESIQIRKGFVEPSMLKAKPEMAYQFEREGYFCRDNQSKELVFNKTVGLKDTWSQ